MQKQSTLVVLISAFFFLAPTAKGENIEIKKTSCVKEKNTYALEVKGKASCPNNEELGLLELVVDTQKVPCIETVNKKNNFKCYGDVRLLPKATGATGALKLTCKNKSEVKVTASFKCITG